MIQRTTRLANEEIGIAVGELHRALGWLGFAVDPVERHGRHLGSSTSAALCTFQIESGLAETGEVDGPTAVALHDALAAVSRLEAFVVSGRVRRGDGSIWAGAEIEVFDLDLRSAQLLGRTRTNASGEYAVSYPRGRYVSLDAGGADLVIRVPRDGAARDRAAVVDPHNAHAHVGPIFNAPAHAVVDLFEPGAADAGRSAWERITSLIAPVLGKTHASELSAEECTFVVNESGVVAGELAHYVRASRLAEASEVAPEAWFALVWDRPRRTDDELAITAVTDVDRILRAAMPLVIPRRDDAWIAAAVRGLHAYAFASWASLPGARHPGFVALIATGDEKIATLFAARLTSFRGHISAFWTSLATDPALGSHVAALQAATQIAVLTRFHAPLIEAVFPLLQGRPVGEVLPKVPDETWDALVAEHGHPEDTTASELVADLRGALESSYSTRFVAARLAKLGIERSEPIASFLETHAADLDLRGAPLAKLLADKPELADSDPAVLEQVARLQRLHRAVGRVDDLAIVMAGGASGAPVIGSAGDIARLGRSEVRRRFGNDDARADRTYDRAIAAYRNAIALWGKIRPEIDRPVGRHIPPALGDHPIEKVPRLPQDLAIDFCGCEKCRSVLGPAAYLADLLATVERLKAPTGLGAKFYLYNRFVATSETRTLRRADLGTIKLDCANATTPMPYIDLVNELLEWHAVGHTDPFTYQTTRTADELLVAPENVLAVAYDTTLLAAVFPWTLPFSLPHETARAFLTHFQLERRSMMLALEGPGLVTSQAERETERLGMIAQQCALVTGSATATAWDVWGLEETGNVVVDPFDTVDHPPHNLPPKTWIEVLQYGMHLRLQSGLEQAALIAALHSRYLARVVGLPVIDWPVTECSFDRAIIHLSPSQAQTLHRFGRLARVLGWSPEALDVALDAIPGPISEDTISAIGGVVGLSRRCRLSVVEATALIAPLATSPETADGVSLYARTFLSPAANPDHQLELALAGGLADLVSPQPAISVELAAVIGSALGLTSSELATIRGAGTTLGVYVVDERLDLANLSRLYRIAALARAARLTVDALIRIIALMTEPPIATTAVATSPFPALPVAVAAGRIDAFFDTMELLHASGFSVEELIFVTTGEDIGARPLTPSDSAITARLAELRTALATIVHDVGWPLVGGALPVGFDTTALRSWLAIVASSDDAAALIDLIGRISTAAADGLLVDRVFAALEPDAIARPAFVLAARTKLVDAATMITDLNDRMTFVATTVLRGISLARQRRAIAKKLAEVFALSDDAATDFLARPLPNAGTAPVQDRFATFELVDAAQLTAVVDTAHFGIWFTGYRLLHKQSLTARKWRFSDDELAIAVRLGGSGLWFDFDSIPLVPDPAGAPHRFTAWVALARAVRLRDSIVGATRSLFATIELAQTTPTAAVVAELARWNGADPERLADVASTIALPSGLGQPRAIERLFAAYAIVSSLGVATGTAQQFAAPALDLSTARGVRDSVRASRPIAEWVGIAKPIQDRLRTRQRDALVAYLGATWHMTPRRLFDFLLIDVEMSDCQLTSRIQQAVCSVQLFIQRVTLHLELAGTKPLVMIDEERDEWNTWVSTYVSWVAARTVFLYPESTLDPALRPGKSEPFVALEKKIDQADVTSDLARDLLLDYLDAVDQVGFLETRAVYREGPNMRVAPLGGVNIAVSSTAPIHVLARTRSAPYRYFYRQFVDSRWTTWEAVDLDIDDDHVVMTVVDGRLFAYWTKFTTANGDVTTTRDLPGKDSTAQPTPNYEIRLAWSERKHGKWQAKRVTRESILTPVPPPPQWRPNVKSDPPNVVPQPADYSLHPVLGAVAKTIVGSGYIGDDGDLWILVRHQRTRTVTTTSYAATIWGETVTSTVTAADDVYLGWFVFAGCNGHVRTRDILQATYDVTKVSHADGQVGPLPGDPANAIESDDWVQNGKLDLQRGGVDVQVLQQSGPSQVAHAMGFTSTTDQFFQPPMVWSDDRRAYAILPNSGHAELDEWTDADLMDPSTVIVAKPVATQWQAILAQQSRPYRFETFFHPYTCALIQTLNREPDPWHAVRALLSPASQGLAAAADEPFTATYLPVDTAIERPYPQERIEFDFDRPYAPYNWELFLHVPILVADRLRTNQRFDEAIRWLQLVFDPTSLDAATNAANAWQFAPFRGRSDLAIQELLALLDYKGTDLDLKLARSLMTRQLMAWRRDALDPHAVALHRPGAWMRAIVMRYVDTLIAWGDSLFRRETIEGINQATLMYLLALDVLGEREPDYPSRAVIAPMTYEELAAAPLDKFSNALVQIENWVPPTGPQPTPAVPVPAGMSFYFCIPRNAKLEAYWDVLADRLFKVRHCLDIDGNLRQLSLFDGLVDLVDRARGLGDALDGQGAIPTYRFQILLAKSCELANDVQKFGGALLSALEKKDAESLALLRSSHERALLAAVHDVKARQVDEASETLDTLTTSRKAAQTRLDYYSSRPFMNVEETSHVALVEKALPLQDAAGSLESLAGFLHLIPDFDVGVSGFCASPVSTFKFGGSQLGQATSAIAAAIRTQAGHLTSQAALAQTIGGYRRRADDWTLQRDLASIEIAQIDRQIAAAEIRLEVARMDLSNQELQMRHADEVAAFLTTKFTSAELYGWLVEQLGVLYLRAYENAYDLSKRAERAFQFERGEPDTTFLQPAYFDKLRKGLLAGERLELDLRRMEAAYFEQNRREFELTKHISLVQSFPAELIKLLTKGECDIELPERMFDLDHPGHYFRRIKTLALSLPCVGGAFASVNAKVTITSSKVRIDPDSSLPYEEQASPSDPRFIYRWASVESFAVSTGQNDAGVFDLNLRDDRYLPCEGAGAIAKIHVELPLQQPDIDPRRVSDAILHLKYTARDGGALKDTVAKAVELGDGVVFASARHDLPDAWQAFATPTAGPRTLSMDLRADRFPYWAIAAGPTITPTLTIVLSAPLVVTGGVAFSAAATVAQPGIASATSITFEPSPDNQFLLVSKGIPSGVPGVWVVEVDPAAIPNPIVDIAIVAVFTT